MNPLRGLAWRTRTFLSAPTHDSESRVRERLDQVDRRLDELTSRVDRAEATAAGRFDHLVSMIGDLARANTDDRDETRRLHVVLRSQLEDRQAEIEDLARAVNGVQGSVGSPSDRA